MVCAKNTLGRLDHSLEVTTTFLRCAQYAVLAEEGMGGEAVKTYAAPLLRRKCVVNPPPPRAALERRVEACAPFISDITAPCLAVTY